ncbi:hypothetical protein KRX52_13045 [Pseudomonas sp. MAP12]|uniref:Uncharacterized protein n=1 Tax=Geopseudomonas aromaticivorans TaxID=2849492 RepID=A0ABS6MY10_9GAMM|nr:hypothetical protein [Pseudomonas aromaticivorans]MBV2133707.1 hypothetical protein [Pseudomonas aromaticivorans]
MRPVLTRSGETFKGVQPRRLKQRTTAVRRALTGKRHDPIAGYLLPTEFA